MDTLEVLILKELSLNEQSVDFGLATIQLRAHGTGDRRWSGVILSHRLDGHDWSGDVLHMAGETDDGRRVEGSALAWTDRSVQGELRLRGTEPLRLGYEEW